MPALKNQRHERFAQALASGMDADHAYQEAGYTANRGNASRLKATENVQARIKELQERAAANVVVTREWVLNRLVENVNRAMQAEPVLLSDGEPTGEYRYDGSVANRALELLGKEIGMFVERAEVDQTTKIITDEPLSEVDWNKRYGDGAVPEGARQH